MSEPATPPAGHFGEGSLSNQGDVLRPEAGPERDPVTGELESDGRVHLRGKELDDALKQAGLPRAGTADEKRARLEAHRRGDA